MCERYLEITHLARFLKEEVLDGAGVGIVHHEGELRRSQLHLAHRLGTDSDGGALLHNLLEAACAHTREARADAGRSEARGG